MARQLERLWLLQRTLVWFSVPTWWLMTPVLMDPAHLTSGQGGGTRHECVAHTYMHTYIQNRKI